MNNIETIEEKVKCSLNIIEKIKSEMFLIKEKKAYLEAYDKNNFFSRDDLLVAINISKILIKKEKRVLELTNEFRKLISEIEMLDSNDVLIQIAEKETYY